MAVMGLLFPAVLHYTPTEVHFGESELALSRFYSCIMIVTYAAFLFFQLKFHKNPYDPLNEEWSQTEESSDDNEGPEILKWESIIWLLIMTAWISILSEYLVHAIECCFAPNCGECHRACKCYYVCRERQASSHFCTCWLDSGATYGLKLSAFRDSNAFYDCISSSLHAAGHMLILCYLIVAASFFVQVDHSQPGDM
nr:vacuolar cation/proton exchanger 5 [Quercus suber]